MSAEPLDGRAVDRAPVDRLRVAIAGAGETAARVVTVTFSSETGLAVTFPLTRPGALRLADSLRKAAGPPAPALLVADGHP